MIQHSLFRNEHTEKERGKKKKKTISLFFFFNQIVNRRFCSTLLPRGQVGELIISRSSRSQSIIKALVTGLCEVQYWSKPGWVFP